MRTKATDVADESLWNGAHLIAATSISDDRQPTGCDDLSHRITDHSDVIPRALHQCFSRYCLVWRSGCEQVFDDGDFLRRCEMSFHLDLLTPDAAICTVVGKSLRFSKDSG